MTDVLVAEDVRKRYGDTVALDGVSLSVDAGEVFGLIGPNGAGKTTLVRTLTGTASPDAGDVALFGRPPAAVDRARIGLLPQAFDPPGRLTARELVGYYGGLYDEARDPEAVLADVGLTQSDTWYERLSGGQQRRACMACALVNDPDLLVLDEPTTGIDPAGRRALWELLEAQVDAGTTVFLTTHDMAEAERLSDRVALLADGSLVADGSPEALVREYGGEPKLSVATGAGTGALADSGYRVSSTGTELVLHGVGATEIDAAVGTLERQGIEYDALQWRQPSLEDVYLELAGRRFEGGPAPNAGRASAAGGASR